MAAVFGGLSAQEMTSISEGNVDNGTVSPASEQEENAGFREIDGKLNDKVKKNIIDAFKGYPCLWNTTLADYKDKKKKIQASKELAGRFNISVEELEKRCLHSLRTSMTRELKRRQESETYVSKWKFFKAMEYLSDEIMKSLNGSQEAEWLDEEVETVVELYRENEFQWNHHLADYKDRNKRSLAMEKLQEMLGMKRSVEEIKSQWHSLKTIFEREHKRVMGSKRSGTGTDCVYRPSWKFFSMLQFLLQCKELDESTSTLSTRSTDEETPQPRGKRHKAKDSNTEELNNVKLKVWKEALAFMKPDKPEEDSSTGTPQSVELKSFSKVVEATLARFSERQRAFAKKRINDVLFEVEMEDENMDRGSRTTYQQRAYQQPTYQQHGYSQMPYLPMFSAERSSTLSPSCSDRSYSSRESFGQSFTELHDLG